MTHEHGIRGVSDQFRYAARPGSVCGLGWLRHARGLHDVVGAQIPPEHRFPINLPGSTSRLAGTVNHEDSLRLGLRGDHRTLWSRMNCDAPPCISILL